MRFKVPCEIKTDKVQNGLFVTVIQPNFQSLTEDGFIRFSYLIDIRRLCIMYGKTMGLIDWFIFFAILYHNYVKEWTNQIAYTN